MSLPIEIHFRDLAPSESVERQVRDWADKLAVANRIDRCEMLLAQPHRHHRRGRRFHVGISLAVPGETIVISGDPGDDGAHEDAHVAIRDAFLAARRRLAMRTHGRRRMMRPESRGRP